MGQSSLILSSRATIVAEGILEMSDNDLIESPLSKRDFLIILPISMSGSILIFSSSFLLDLFYLKISFINFILVPQSLNKQYFSSLPL